MRLAALTISVELLATWASTLRLKWTRLPAGRADEHRLDGGLALVRDGEWDFTACMPLGRRARRPATRSRRHRLRCRLETLLISQEGGGPELIKESGYRSVVTLDREFPRFYRFEKRVIAVDDSE